MAAKLNYTALILVVLLVTGGTSPLLARPQAQNQDTMNALLVEVRGLRAAMEQLASAGPRVQLLFGRLQLQEERINDQVRRVDELRAKIKTVTADESRTRAQLQRYEEFIKSNPASHEIPDLQAELPGLRKALANFSADVLRLQGEEASLLSDIATDQARWNDINRALDELDRALTRR